VPGAVATATALLRPGRGVRDSLLGAVGKGANDGGGWSEILVAGELRALWHRAMGATGRRAWWRRIGHLLALAGVASEREPSGGTGRQRGWGISKPQKEKNVLPNL
jgi:hypothetical protein